MSRIPIRARLTLAFALVMALVFAAIGVFVYVRVGDALLSSVDQSLRVQAADVMAHGLADRDPGGGVTLAQRLDARGRVLGTSRPLPAPLLTPAAAAQVAAGATVWRSVSPRGIDGDWRVLALPARGSRVVAVARSLEPREETLDRLSHELQIAFLLALVLASAAGYGLAASALRPVEAMRRRAASVSASRLGRLPVPHARDEMSRLAVTLNDMLARLQEAFEHERRFVADASHELRTPLALLRTELELALRRPRSQEELERALRSAAEETVRLTRLAEDLLLLARADQDSLPIQREYVPAGEVLAAVAARYDVRAREEARALHVDATDAILHADPLRVEQAVGNLVDNAFAYGGGEIILSAVERDGMVELHVTDAGSGFPEEFVARAFDRFSRADHARSRGGAGLGLSIVALVARAHGGRAGAANRPRGGADVWLTVPRAGSPAASPPAASAVRIY